MEALKEFPEEYSGIFKLSLKLLNQCNFRYLQNESFLKKYWRFTYLVLVVLLHLITFGVHLTNQVSKREMIDVAYMLPVYLVCVRSIIKGIIIISKNTETSAILSELGALWRLNYTKEQTVEKNKLLKGLTICVGVNYWVAYLSLWQYLTTPFLETLIRRLILNQDSELLLPVSYPFNFNGNWLFYMTIYIFQCYIMTLTIYIHLGGWLMLINLSALLANEFTMLQDDLTHIKPALKARQQENIDSNNLAAFIQRHQKIIRLSGRVDKVYNGIIFIDLLFVGITTCGFTFASQFAPGKMYAFYNYMAVATTMVTVFSMCYYGELLTEASERLGDVAYNNFWYEGDLNYKKAIWLIIKISQSPCYLTSIRYSKISLRMFTKVMSTTWSYLSLMNSVYAEEEE